MSDLEVRAATLFSALLLNDMSESEYKAKRVELNSLPGVVIIQLPRDERYGIGSCATTA